MTTSFVRTMPVVLALALASIGVSAVAQTAAPATAEPTTTVPVAADDADAKAGLIAAITAGGLEAIDAGSLARAHELESIGFLQLTLAVGEQIGWTGGLALVR